MTFLEVGKGESGPFQVPLEIAGETIALKGVRGTGKTVTATVLVESVMDAGVQVIVIDPTDVWWGLKSSLDGKSEGYPVVVLGGERGDLPLEEHDGRILADFAVEHRPSMVLSLRHMRKAAQQRFVTAFVEQLYHRKGKVEHRQPLFLVIDEASAFVPQRVDSGAAKMVGAIEDVVRRGRASGFGVCLIDQRPASVNKNVLTQLQMLVAHQITSPQDRKALTEWIDQHDSGGHREQFLAELASLKRGHAYFWAPKFGIFERVAVRMRRTFDSSATPPMGKQIKAPKKVAAVDLEALKEQIGATVERARADDPAYLKKEIRRLEKELKESKAEVAVPDMTPIREWVESARSRLDQLEALADQVEQAEGKPILTNVRVRSNKMHPPPRRETLKPTTVVGRSDGDDAFRFRDPHQRMLNALSEFKLLGTESLGRRMLAVLSKQSPKSSAVGKNIRELKAAGLIAECMDSTYEITAAGSALVSPAEPPRTLEQFQEQWYALLKPASARVLKAVVDAYPETLSPHEIAERSDISPTSSALGAAIRELRSFGCLGSDSGFHYATELMFPEGL